MRHFLLYLHIFGFILWMGGGFAAMSTGRFMQQLPRNQLGFAVQVQGRLMGGLILPGAVMVVLSGLILTLRLYGSATSVGGFSTALMVMQGAGLVGPAITLVVAFPAITRSSHSSTNASDNVFSDGTSTEMATLVGDTTSGYTATITLGVSV